MDFELPHTHLLMRPENRFLNGGGVLVIKHGNRCENELFKDPSQSAGGGFQLKAETGRVGTI